MKKIFFLISFILATFLATQAQDDPFFPNPTKGSRLYVSLDGQDTLRLIHKADGTFMIQHDSLIRIDKLATDSIKASNGNWYKVVDIGSGGSEPSLAAGSGLTAAGDSMNLGGKIYGHTRLFNNSGEFTLRYDTAVGPLSGDWVMLNMSKSLYRIDLSYNHMNTSTGMRERKGLEILQNQEGIRVYDSYDRYGMKYMSGVTYQDDPSWIPNLQGVRTEIGNSISDYVGQGLTWNSSDVKLELGGTLNRNTTINIGSNNQFRLESQDASNVLRFLYITPTVVQLGTANAPTLEYKQIEMDNSNGHGIEIVDTRSNSGLFYRSDLYYWDDPKWIPNWKAVNDRINSRLVVDGLQGAIYYKGADDYPASDLEFYYDDGTQILFVPQSVETGHINLSTFTGTPKQGDIRAQGQYLLYYNGTAWDTCNIGGSGGGGGVSLPGNFDAAFESKHSDQTSFYQITYNDAKDTWGFTPLIKDTLLIQGTVFDTLRLANDWFMIPDADSVWMEKPLGTYQFTLGSGTGASGFSGSFNDLTDVPPNLDTDYTDDFDGNFLSLSGIPAGLIDGDDDTQLSETQVDNYVSNNGYLTSEVDGSTSNELQTLSVNGQDLSISSGNTVTIPTSNGPYDNDQILETQSTGSQVGSTETTMIDANCGSNLLGAVGNSIVMNVLFSNSDNDGILRIKLNATTQVMIQNIPQGNHRLLVECVRINGSQVSIEVRLYDGGTSGFGAGLINYRRVHVTFAGGFGASNTLVVTANDASGNNSLQVGYAAAKFVEVQF